MNRSILIVICDFLLVSLLAFSAVDLDKPASEGVARPVKTDLATNQVESGKDLAAVMRLALNDERRSRDKLQGELTQTREALNKQQALTSEREQQMQSVQQTLQAREQEMQTVQQSLHARDQEVQAFQQALQAREQQAQLLQQEETNLVQRLAAAQTSAQTLNQQVQAQQTEASVSKEKLAEMEAAMRKQMEQAAALQQQLTSLTQSNALVLVEKQQLAGQLQVAEAEKRAATEKVALIQDEVKVEREEKAKLAEDVKTLATRSSELAQEVRENRPQTANAIFNDFLTNRVAARFYAAKTGLFGNESVKRRDTETILISNGTNTFALCHVQETPLTLWNPGTDWEGLTGTLGRNTTILPIRTLVFCLRDPRVVLIPLNSADTRQLGCRVYSISSDPFKFQDAVLVGAREGYYGECKFQIDASTPEYVKLDHNFLKGIFGKFNPSRGDLVFSKTGELLGIMANSTYCMMLQSFDGAARFEFAQDVRSQHTGAILGQLYGMVANLPFKLQ
jgi:hypothetical protein